MSLSSPLLIVCFDQDEAQAMSEMARSLGYPDAHTVIGGIAEAVGVLNARPKPPDYILIDIGNRGREILAELDELALHCESSVRVVVIGAVNDILFYREIRQRGILEYYTKPVQASDVRQMLILSPVVQPRAAVVSSTHGSVIACMSAASGDGASTLAVNLAYCLAEEYGQPTVLVDMDYQFGLLAKSLDLTAPFGIREVFDHPDRGLDDTLVSKMLVKYTEKLAIIASPAELRLLPMIRPELIRGLVGILRSQFRFVIIDIPHIWTDWTAAALTYSDQAVMVAQLWLRSLTHASRLLTGWQGIGVGRDNVSLVINRSGAKFKEAITAEDFERICHHKIIAHMNNDIKSVAHAEKYGKTIFETGQGAMLQQQVKQFAHMLVERCQGTQPPHMGQSAGAGKRKLLTLFDKKTG